MVPLIIAGVAAAAGLVAKAIGDAIAAGERGKAIALAEQALEKAKGIKPPIQEVLALVQQIESDLPKYREDPRLKSQQMRALDALQGEVEMRGMTPEAREQYDLARAEAGGIASGLEGAAAQRAAQRGVGGLASYAGALGGSQAAANRAGQMGVGIAADARKRYLQALESLGGMAGQVRGQEFGMAAQRAAAQDAINRFNAEMQSKTNLYNAQAGQRDFDNQLAQAQAEAAAAAAAAGQYNQSAAEAKKSAADYAEAFNQVGKAGASYYGGK